LLSEVWEQEFGVETNVVDVYIGYLRKKVDASGESQLIQTVRGVGYALRKL
jgi:DNA-binding response OmpR family regulator